MDKLNQSFVDWLLDSFHLRAFASDLRHALFVSGVLLVVFAALEWRAGRDLRRYRSRGFLTDVSYRVYSTFYMVVLYAPLSAAIQVRYPALNLRLLNQAPLWIGIPVYWAFFDFLGYWIHRLQHTRVLWRFHRVHHSQESLSFLTGFRTHPVDSALAMALTLVPLLIVGAPPVAWLPYSALVAFADGMHHADLPWRLGPFRKLFVSPVFHSAHHATEPELFDRNFGSLFSCWDYFFGTAADVTERPARTGVRGWTVRESFWAHFASPFRRGAVAAEPDDPRRLGTR